jgi:hypothetical protein
LAFPLTLPIRWDGDAALNAPVFYPCVSVLLTLMDETPFAESTTKPWLTTQVSSP